MQDPVPMPAGLVPGPPLGGWLRVPPSKSLAQRALLFACLVPGRTHLLGIPRQAPPADVAAALALVPALGRSLTWHGPRALSIEGIGPGHAGGLAPKHPLEVAESGTLARLTTALVALCSRSATTVRGHGSLARRRSPALFRALTRAGAQLEPVHDAAPGGWPVLVRGIGPPPDLFLEDPESSQELTALLLAAAAYPDSIHIHLKGALPSRPYVELTRRMLAEFGVRVARTEPYDSDHDSLSVSGAARPPERPLELEPDASAAAVGLAAAAITGGSVEVPGDWTASLQGDAEVTLALARFGVDTGRDGTGLRASGPVQSGADLDLVDHPDLAPPLAAVAAAAAIQCGESSRLSGLAGLRGKESDRLAGLADALSAIGLAVAIEDEALVLGPPRGELSGATLDPRGDHRMAFAFALLGLLVPGVTLTDPSVVSKSWPSFWTDLSALGASPTTAP
ncbi:MAG: hypothetical protein P1V81_15535 [Planctomycetota bacterium]|nr:hypothetical protein [Planctomycetota bacterium]